MYKKNLDVKIALLLIIILTFLTWWTVSPPGSILGDSVAGAVAGLAIYGIIRLW